MVASPIDSELQVGIVLLNWNGWADTLACLDSVLTLTHPTFDVFVVDNGSTDDSLERLRTWATTHYPADRIAGFLPGEPALPFGPELPAIEQRPLGTPPPQGRFVLVPTGENLGFASGCNVGMARALAEGVEAIWLLNNDTTVEAEALTHLVAFLAGHPRFDGVTGQIRYHWNPGVIWNCGGELTWYGTRRYLYNNDPVTSVPQAGWRPVSFITGCSLLLRASLLREVGLLSDKFFFGEEDIEFCYRLKKQGRRLACVFASVIYHKVGASTEGLGAKGQEGKVYIHLLNRFINMRNYYPPLAWRLWRWGVLAYVGPMLLLRYRLSLPEAWRMMAMLLRESVSKQRVTREDFFGALGTFAAGVEPMARPGHPPPSEPPNGKHAMPVQPHACFFSNESAEQLKMKQYSLQDIAILRDLGFRVTIATSFSEVPFGCDLYFSWWASGSILPLVKARLSRRPILVVAGGNEAMFYLDSRTGMPQGYLAAPWYKRLATRLCLRLADRILIVSPFMERDVRALGAADPLLVPNSVDTLRFVPGTAERSVVTTIFDLEERVVAIKRGEEFIRALPLVLARFPEARFAIIGRKGKAFPRLSALAESLDLGDHLTFVGHIDNAEVVGWMQKSLAYVQISDTETFGVAVAEAMSCGTPVVVSRRGALPDLVGDLGIFVDQNDPRSVAQGLCEALNMPQEARARWGCDARARVEQRCSYEARREAVRGLIEGLTQLRTKPW